MLRSFRAYRLHSEWPDTEDALSRALEGSPFKPCNAYSEQSYGFEPPVEDAGDLLCRSLAGADLVQLRIQSRLLPTAVVKEALAERVAEFTARTQREPNRKETRDLKEDIYGQLLPQALLKSDRLRGYYLKQPKLLIVASPTEKIAELMLTRLRDALGSLQVTPLAFKKPTRGLIHEVFLGDHKGPFNLGRECRMRDAGEPSSSVSWMDVDLFDSSVRKHVKEGMTVDRLAMQFDGILRFVLDEDLVMRKLKFEGLEALDELDAEDPLARHDAEFALEVGVLDRLLEALRKELGGFA